MRVLQPVVSVDAWADRARPITNPLTPTDRVLLVSAHPDDETIGAGRLVAGHGGPVLAVTLSAGESCVVDERLDPVDLGLRRLAEWRCAVHHLGAEPLETDRWPDGRLESCESDIADQLAELSGDVDVVVGTWRHDPHPDHQAVGRSCARAAERSGVRLVEFPVWAPYWMSSAEVEGHDCTVGRVECGGQAAQHRALALEEYVSQTQPLLPGWDPVVPAAMLGRHAQQYVVGQGVR